MTGLTGGIIRVATQTATTGGRIASRAVRIGHWLVVVGRRFALVAIASITLAVSQSWAWQDEQAAAPAAVHLRELKSYSWDFGRSSDLDFLDGPDGWKRAKGIGYPSYVRAEIVARDPTLESRFVSLDTAVFRVWQRLKQSYPSLPLPPSIADSMVDRYYRITLDGGQFETQSPAIPASRMFQYRFSCQIMTKGLRYDRASAELVFLDREDQKLAAYSTPHLTGTTKWTPLTLDLVRPPVGAAKMLVRLLVERSEDGFEDIRGTIGFDDIRIDQYPQLQVTTDKTLGVYAYGSPIHTTAKIMGLPPGASKVGFRVLDSNGEEVASRRLPVRNRVLDKPADDNSTVDSSITWRLPRIDPGFYRITASLDGQLGTSLATETTIAVIDDLIGGPPHGCFGWTLDQGHQGIAARDLATWLADLGVAWVKYPSWIPPDDTEGAEEIAMIFNKLQDSGIQTVGMLDVPPESQLSNYELRGRKDMVAAQLFRDVATWQPLLEPVMSRLTLKVRTWQLGADRDHSFLGRPRLQESIRRISTGLQGFGQPIDVAISWPWLEPELPNGDSSWQAICRSSEPPLGAAELDAHLELRQQDVRNEVARTWLLLDAIPKSNYDRDSRIRDLVLRMATVRGHRVQAAFVSSPRDPETGLLRANGRPGELLLPWRTTSRLIGNLRKVGSLKLRSGAANSVFAGDERAVLMLWSAEPTEELMYLGEHIQSVDVWGKVTNLPIEMAEDQPIQRVQIGPMPIFIIGADPQLLAFRMSVDVQPKQLDSLLGQVQKFSVSFTNPSRESLVGEMRAVSPDTWSVDAPERSWEALAGRTAQETFRVVLSNTAKIGRYDVPIRFSLDTVPPKMITVYREMHVGPEGLEVKVTTRLLGNGELRVQVELTNHASRPQPYDCMLFPPPGRQYQRRLLTVQPGETITRKFYWTEGEQLVGQQMLLRAAEQDGQRVLNYAIDVTR